MPRPPLAHQGQYNSKSRQIIDVVVDPCLSKFLRPHQIEGVKFLYECTLGYRDTSSYGCILADEMGLGKTLQTISLVWTLLKQSPYHGENAIIRKVLIVCPASLLEVLNSASLSTRAYSLQLTTMSTIRTGGQSSGNGSAIRESRHMLLMAKMMLVITLSVKAGYIQCWLSVMRNCDQSRRLWKRRHLTLSFAMKACVFAKALLNMIISNWHL